MSDVENYANIELLTRVKEENGFSLGVSERGINRQHSATFRARHQR